MYKIAVPVINRKMTDTAKAQFAEVLKKSCTDTVFLVVHRVLQNEAAKLEEMNTLKENLEFFKLHGLNVGAWLCPTIGYSMNPNSSDYEAAQKYTHLHSLEGYDMAGAYCPLDNGYTDEFCDYLLRIASLGIKEIMFEDDFNLTGGKRRVFDPSCYCELHKLKFEEYLGEKLSDSEMLEQVYSDKPNRYRDAWIKIQGDTLRDFVSKIEREVHKSYPDVRMGLSANASSYETEGETIDELERILAGNTKPFIRLTGAPYWSNNNHARPYGAIIDTERLQTYWCGNDIELLVEGDACPHDERVWVPSAYLEGLDMIMRAEGKANGILKYMFSYVSNPNMELGYMERHLRNSNVYKEIEERFKDKETVGLNVFENKQLFKDKVFENKESFEHYRADLLPTISQWMLGDMSVPTVYGGTVGATLCFGENARYLTEEHLKRGVILDAVAANMLTEKGIDVGIKKGELTITPVKEYYFAEEDSVAVKLPQEGYFYKYELNEKANVLSVFFSGESPVLIGLDAPTDSENSYPACYLYENSKGQRFMVYSFDASSTRVENFWMQGLFRKYYRQHQFAYGVEWLQGRKLPVMCFDNPQLYTFCKSNDKSMSVIIWNFFADSVLNPKIVLDKEYKTFDCKNYSGTLEGNILKLDREIPPYGFVMFTVKE